MAEQTMPSPVAAAAARQPMTARHRWATFIQGVWFVLGFATFVIGVMGLATTALGDVFYDGREIIRLLGGAALIVFGLFTLRIINIPALYADTRRGLGGVGKGVGAARSYITGLSFAAGWSPCIGPFLGAILSLGATADLPNRIGLLVAYTLGLGIPFLIVAALADRAAPVLNKLKKNMRTIEVISGLLLIAIGIAMLLGLMQQFTSQIILSTGLSNGLDAALPDTLQLSIPVAALAGFLSFTSPCVLPLIPAYIAFLSGVAVNQYSKA
jgi:cytochrome c-type biogenesis protein